VLYFFFSNANVEYRRGWISMAIKDIFKVSRKTFINPSGWLGYTELKSSTTTAWELMRGLFYTPKDVNPETFEEAMTRLNLTEEDIKQQSVRYFNFAVLFITLAVVSFLFAFYLLFVEHTFAGCLLGLAVTALFGSQAFRYHFWYFQIQRRKLGCTFEEWKQNWFNPTQGPSA
jgi:intracellular multiplication protein IcmV